MLRTESQKRDSGERNQGSFQRGGQGLVASGGRYIGLAKSSVHLVFSLGLTVFKLHSNQFCYIVL